MHSGPMSLLEPLRFDNDCISGSKTMSGNGANVAEFVNPQCTDKRYCTMELDFMTPETSPTDATPRRGSFLSENMSTFLSGSSGASSLISHSGCGTPSSSTPGSSASNSRRQSILLPESRCYLSGVHSSPSNRPRMPNRVAAIDQYSLQASPPGSYMASTDNASLEFGTPVGGELNIAVDDYTEQVPRQWPSYGPQTDNSLLCGDLVAEFTNTITARISHNFEPSQSLFDHIQPSLLDSAAPQPETEGYGMVGDPSSHTPSLGPPFELCAEKYENDVAIVDDDILSNAATAGHSYLGDVLMKQPLNDSSHHPRRSRSTVLRNYNLSSPSDDDLECDHAASPRARKGNRKQRQSQRPDLEVYSSFKSHRCKYCDHACNRQEHLKRHEKSKHWEEKTGEETEWHPCAFDDCVDRRTGMRRTIKARADNLKAHYDKTHFKYGNSEKGGKNSRKSMKEAHQMGLRDFDYRWTLLLGEKMDVNHETDKFLHVWKMLGYSIIETRDIRVKDVVPDWQGPHDQTLPKFDLNQTLQNFDPRWKAMWDRTLTFDKAMSRGLDMKESEAQGLLGVTMMETEAMGIKHLDPRWAEMLSGRMSVEQSEKLGVKQRNPVWKDLVARRRAR